MDVLVVGGGATGAGIARDLSMRGVGVMLLERADFCSGSSGGNHGLLHSGARYAVRDPESARECAVESKILKKVAWNCIDDTGGVFVRTRIDDPDYPDVFASGCKAAGVSAKGMTPRELAEREPGLSKEIEGGFAVEDASVDPFRLVLTNIEDARANGAVVRNYCEVVALERTDGRIASVRFIDHRNGTAGEVRPELIVNAAGSLAGGIANIAGVGIGMTRDYGTLVVFNGRLVKGLVNRLRPPSDGDIIVPSHTSMIAGTTSRAVSSNGSAGPTREDVELIRREASEMIPGIGSCRAIRAYGASRPLASNEGGRGSSRTFKLIDHASDGVDNLISIIGGKLTTYRLMAESTSDLVCAKLGVRTGCRTATEPMVERTPYSKAEWASAAQNDSMARRYGRVPSEMFTGKDLERLDVQSCSCENVMKFELEHYAGSEDITSISDLMRRTRAGMGYCQGSACLWEMASTLSSRDRDVERLVKDFIRERRCWSEPAIEGDQLRQEVFRSHLIWPIGTVKEGRR